VPHSSPNQDKRRKVEENVTFRQTSVYHILFLLLFSCTKTCFHFISFVDFFSLTSRHFWSIYFYSYLIIFHEKHINGHLDIQNLKFAQDVVVLLFSSISEKWDLCLHNASYLRWHIEITYYFFNRAISFCCYLVFFLCTFEMFSKIFSAKSNQL